MRCVVVVVVLCVLDQAIDEKRLGGLKEDLQNKLRDLDVVQRKYDQAKRCVCVCVCVMASVVPWYSITYLARKWTEIVHSPMLAIRSIPQSIVPSISTNWYSTSAVPSLHSTGL